MTADPARERRLIVGNLDCEAELAGKPARLPLRVRRRIAAASTLLRVFARPTDRLWTIEPVAPERLVDSLDLPRPTLESGPLKRLAPAAELLAWGETPAVARLRGQPHASARVDEAPLSEALWHAPVPPTAAVRQVSDRTFQLTLAERLGVAFEQATVIDSVEQLAAQLRSARCPRWVVKAPYSAAGRDRVLGRGEALEPAGRRQAEKLLARFGALVFEPWVERLLDFSCCALAKEGSVRHLGLQQQQVHGSGGFVGSWVWREPAFLSPAETEVSEKIAIDVGRALQAVGFVGPFGIDGFCYRDARGERRLHPLGEINPRLTFGFVARALAERVWNERPDSASVRLQLGRAHELPPATRDAWPLLSASPEDDTAAWVERSAAPTHRSTL